MNMTVQLSEGDALAAQRLCCPWWRSAVNFVCIYGGVIAVLAVGSVPVTVIGVVAGLAAFVTVYARLVGLPRVSRRLFLEHKMWRMPYDCRWDGDEFAIVQDPYGWWRYPWDHVLKWKENERIVLVFTSSASFYIIPKSAFSDESQVHSLRETLAANVGGRGAAPPPPVPLSDDSAAAA